MSFQTYMTFFLKNTKRDILRNVKTAFVHESQWGPKLFIDDKHFLKKYIVFVLQKIENHRGLEELKWVKFSFLGDERFFYQNNQPYADAQNYLTC